MGEGEGAVVVITLSDDWFYGMQLVVEQMDKTTIFSIEAHNEFKRLNEGLIVLQLFYFLLR